MQQTESMPTTVAGESSAAPQIVIPPSQIIQVPRPQDDYYRCVGLLISVFATTAEWGTGTIVTTGPGKYGILTCAHNVYDKTTRVKPSYSIFAPAITSGQKSNAVIALQTPAIRIPSAYTGVKDDPSDYAVIRLSTDQLPANLGSVPTMQTLERTELGTVQVTGYPFAPPTIGAPTPAMYYGQGPQYPSTDARFLRYRASTLHGMSGSGVCRVDTENGNTPDLATITGVHVAGHEDVDPTKSYNSAIYLTSDIIAWITGQIAA